MSEHSDRIVLIGIANDEIEANIWRDILAREAIAVFVKSSEKEVSARERAIAEIARAVHDFFLFQPHAGL